MKKTEIIKQQERLRVPVLKDINRLKKLKARYKLPIEVRIKNLSNRNGLKVFLVDGCKIRHFIDFDFTMGGHGLRYVYVPMNEIWIDSSNESEAEEIILHEITEFNLMKKGRSYNKAHELASLQELEFRNNKIILPVNHHRQITPWSCGASALKIVLDYYKDVKPIKQIIKETKSSPILPYEGTLHKYIVKALRRWNYKFKEKKNATLKCIEYFVQKAVPVIVDYQDHHGGHFSVVIGYDKNRFLLSDPASDKKFKWISKKDFLRRWWEEDEPGKIVKRWMLAVYNKTN